MDLCFGLIIIFEYAEWMNSNKTNLLVVTRSGCFILKFRLTSLYLDLWWFDDVALVSQIKYDLPYGADSLILVYFNRQMFRSCRPVKFYGLVCLVCGTSWFLRWLFCPSIVLYGIRIRSSR